MEGNKLYLKVAEMYTGFKNLLGINTNINEAVDDRIEKHPSVFNAKRNFSSIDDRISNTETKISNNYMQLNKSNNQVNDLKNEIDIVKTQVADSKGTIEKVEIEDKKLIVNVADTSTIKEDEFTIDASSTYILKNNGGQYYDKSYIKIDPTGTNNTKQIQFTTPSIVGFNDAVNVLSNQVISAKGNVDNYELPLNTCQIYYNEGMDACNIPNIGMVYADYADPKNNISKFESLNHLANALRRSTELPWVINKYAVTVNFILLEEILLNNIIVDYNFINNSNTSSIVIEYADKSETYKSLLTSSDKLINSSFPNGSKVKFIRIRINIFDKTTTNFNIKLNGIQLFSESYNSESDIVTTLLPYINTSSNDNISIDTNGDTDSSPYIDTKFSLSFDNALYFTYIPKVWNILPTDFFYKRWTTKFVNPNSLNSKYKIEKNTTYKFVGKTIQDYTSLSKNSLNYSVGNNILTDTQSVGINNSIKFNEKGCFCLQFDISGTSYDIQLQSSYMLTPELITVGTFNFYITIYPLTPNVCKIFIQPGPNTDINIKVNVKLKVVGIKNLGAGKYNGSGDNYYYTESSSSTIDYSTKKTILNGYELMYEQFNIYYYMSWAYYSRSWTTWPVSNSSWNNGYFDYMHVWHAPFWYYWTSYQSGWGGFTNTNNYLDSLNGNSYIYTAMLSEEGNTMPNDSTVTDTAPLYCNTVSALKQNCGVPISIFVSNDETSMLNAIKSDNIIFKYIYLSVDYSYDMIYDTKLFIGSSGIAMIYPTQISSAPENVLYTLSPDGENYYTYNQSIEDWQLSEPNDGMIIDQLISINETNFKLLFKDWLYVRVYIKTNDVNISKIQVTLNKDGFEPINKTETLDKGMPKRVIEAIDTNTLSTFMSKTGETLYFTQMSKSYLPYYQYKLKGFTITSADDTMWKELFDPTKIEKYILPSNDLMFKNLTTTPITLRTIRTIFKPKSVLVDTTNDVLNQVSALSDKVNTTTQNIELLNQNVGILETNIHNDTKPDAPLPNAIIDDIIEKDLDPLLKGETVELKVLKHSNIQVWENTSILLNQFYDINFINIEDNILINNGNLYTNINGLTVAKDYSITSPYLLPETLLTTKNNNQAIYNNFTITASGYSSIFTGSIISGVFGLDDIYTVRSQFLWSVFASSYAFRFWYDVPGLLASNSGVWNTQQGSVTTGSIPVSLLIDLNTIQYVNYLSNIYAGYNSSVEPVSSDFSTASGVISNQITNFFVSTNGTDWSLVSSFSTNIQGSSVQINKAIRYIKIELSLPYSSNQGVGTVSVNNIDIYVSPLLYKSNLLGNVYLKKYIDISNWSSFDSIIVDRYINHTVSDMKFALSDSIDTNDNPIWKVWNGVSWIIVSNIKNSYSGGSGSFTPTYGMSVEMLESLTGDQLNLLQKDKLNILILSGTSDVYTTSILRDIKFKYTLKDNKESLIPIDNKDMIVRYYKDDCIIKLTNISQRTIKPTIIMS